MSDACIRLFILLLVVPPMTFSACSKCPAGVLVVGGRANEFSRCLESLGVGYNAVESPSDLAGLDLSGFAAVLVCAPDHKRPQTVSRQAIRLLENYAANGGRVLLEFAVPEDSGELFGVRLDTEPVFARHERIVVSRPPAGLKELPSGTLLDEQYSWVLQAASLPDNAVRMLDYGEFVGTYRVKPIPTRFYEFWVDLGAVRTIRAASQRYGGTNPYYCPDSVELLVGTHKTRMVSVGAYSGGWQNSQTASFEFDPVQARYVLFRCARGDDGPGEYWFFAGEITVLDESGDNVALRKKTRVLTPVYEEPWSSGVLTDGVVDGIYSDGQSLLLGAVGSDFGIPKWPALVRLRQGRGAVLALTARISDWRQRRFRPSAKWDALIRGICLELLPGPISKQAAGRYLPLEAHTEPRRWAPPGQKVKLIVTAVPGASISVESATLKVGRLTAAGLGKWTAAVSGQTGEHVIKVSARAGEAAASTGVSLLIADRKAAYERAVRRNMKWFLESGMMPKQDGSAGVHSTIFVPSPNDGPQEDLAGPIRTDCVAMVIDAFVQFYRVSGDPAWLDRARRLGDRLISVQRLDVSRADYGSFPWILGEDWSVKNPHIWFHDNESRVAAGLLNLYTSTGELKYLESAARCLRLSMDVSREDFTIGNHSISPDALNNMGRAAYRELANYTLYHYDVMRWFAAYAATGDEEYCKAADTVARLYSCGSAPHVGSLEWAVGPYAVRLLEDNSLKARIEAQAREMLKDPDVARYGVKLSRGKGSYSLLYRNDCTINTDSEPLADLLYTAPMDLRRAWFAYKASGSRSALEIYEKLADFLVRIQLEDSSPHADGCWVRGFDTELWEDFGAPYDPNYGPYHAYSGWMNSMIAEGLAFYVADTDPFALHKHLWEQSGRTMDEARNCRPPDKVSYANIALNRPYALDPAPLSGSPGALTDGVIDGAVSDGQSVVWEMPEVGRSIEAAVNVDLGAEMPVAMVGARMGALNPRFNADSVEIFVGRTPDALELVAVVQAGPGVTWSVWKQFEPVSCRFVRLVFRKTRFTALQDRLAVGEITLLRK